MIREIQMVALNKETVFLLDDDSSILKSTGRLLDSAGWRVEAFTDPIAFLEHAAIHCPDVAGNRRPYARDEWAGSANAVAKHLALDPSHCADCQR